MPEENEVNYVKVAFAVCGGILLAAIISVAIIVYWFNVSTEQQIDVLNKQMTEVTRQSRQRRERITRETAQRQAEQQKATEQHRAKSNSGRTLFRQCREYSEYYQNQPGQYARVQRDSACEKYRVYVETGRTTP